MFSQKKEAFCILCGNACQESAVPSFPALCRNHRKRNLGAWQIFSEEQARAEGVLRGSKLSWEKKVQEVDVALSHLRIWAEMLGKAPSSQRSVSLDGIDQNLWVKQVCEAKLAYLEGLKEHHGK